MEKAVKEFVDLLLLQRKKCPWARKREILQQLPELEGEVREFREAVESNDVENMREELGDVLWDALFIGVIAEEKGLFTIKEAIEEAHAKLRRRKPWIFGDEEISEEEATRRYKRAKEEEKRAKQK
jgi:tetrapyrrole methylase family protein/MazG family protein